MKIKEKFDSLVKLSHLFSKKEKRHFAGIMAVVLLMAFFQALGIASIFPFIKFVMNPSIILNNAKVSWVYNFFGFQSTKAFLIAFGLAILAVIIIDNFISALAIWVKTRFVWRKNHTLSTALLAKYLSLPYSYFLNHNTADLSKNILDEVQNFTRSFILPVLEILTNIVIVLFILITLMVVNPVSAMIMLVFFCAFYGVIYKTGLRRQLETKGKTRLDENRGRFKAASEALGGIKDIKVLSRENYFLNKFAGHSLRFSDLKAWNTISGWLPRSLFETIVFGGVVVFILVLIVVEGDTKQIIPAVSLFAFAGYRLMPILNKIFQAFTELQFNKVVLDKVYKDFMQDGHIKFDEPEKNIGDEKTLKFEKCILFKDLAFSYSGSGDYVFQDINLSIDKSTSVAIVGPTGSGKTTLVDIILGLLPPTQGAMEVDGVEITDENIKSWRRNLGYVAQHIYLSDDTIRRNIAFGLPDEMIDMDMVEKVAKISNIHDFIIHELPKGYDTVIGERGIRLSGGQRQRVGIARALYNAPDILVLDEATSSLDGITEESVLNEIETISKLKTLIVIAHRLTTVRKCDMIYLLDKGRIIAQGKYDELMANNAQFRAMARES